MAGVFYYDRFVVSMTPCVAVGRMILVHLCDELKLLKTIMCMYGNWCMKSYKKLSCAASAEICKWSTWVRLIQAKMWPLDCPHTIEHIVPATNCTLTLFLGVRLLLHISLLPRLAKTLAICLKGSQHCFVIEVLVEAA
ncbi:hypothetical protein YC2023_089410 [Brassica napus]